MFQSYSHNTDSLVFLKADYCLSKFPGKKSRTFFFFLIKIFSQIFPKQLFSKFAKYVSYLCDHMQKLLKNAQKPP